MGISVKVVPATDDEIRAFTADSDALHSRFWLDSFGDSSYLADFWDAVDFVLTAEGGDALPLCAIKLGDVHYPKADDPTHAIFAATTKRLAQELQALSDATLRRRFDPPKMLGRDGGRMVYPGRLWTGGGEDQFFAELMGYVRRFRHCATQAAAADLGLVFYRYEDF